MWRGTRGEQRCATKLAPAPALNRLIGRCSCQAPACGSGLPPADNKRCRRRASAPCPPDKDSITLRPTPLSFSSRACIAFIYPPPLLLLPPHSLLFCPPLHSLWSSPRLSQAFPLPALLAHHCAPLCKPANPVWGCARRLPARSRCRIDSRPDERAPGVMHPLTISGLRGGVE